MNIECVLKSKSKRTVSGNEGIQYISPRGGLIEYGRDTFHNGVQAQGLD